MITLQIIRPKTVKLLSRIIKPLSDEGVIYIAEEKEIFSNLKHLSEKGNLIPLTVPKLIDQKEAAKMLCLGYNNFKKLEKEGSFPSNVKWLALL